jgi:hypothetical protein
MQFYMPHVKVPNDTKDKIMARSGELVGFSKTRAVWRFGFMDGSEDARVYGSHVPEGYRWALTNVVGKPLEWFDGYAYELPKRFQKIIKAKL